MMLDEDRNGSLSKLELQNGFGNICMLELFQNHVHGTEDDIAEVMEKIDLDNDGKIDYNEFIQAAINH